MVVGGVPSLGVGVVPSLVERVEFESSWIRRRRSDIVYRNSDRFEALTLARFWARSWEMDLLIWK
jgi:hypothetical protein